MTTDTSPSSVRPPDAPPFHVQPEQPRRAPGLFDARPANDTTLTAIELPPRSAMAPAVAAVVGPVRTEFRAPWVRTYATPARATCAECGVKDALVKITRDGKEFPACVSCWRSERTRVPAPKPARVSTDRAAAALDQRILDAIHSGVEMTAREICLVLDLEADELVGRNGRAAAHRDRVKHGLRRLVDAKKIRRRKRRGQRRATFLPVGHE